MTRTMIKTVCATLVLLIASAANAQTIVLDFEDLTGPLAPMPANYAGFESWGNWAHSATPDPNYPPTSGETYLIEVGAPSAILMGDDYIFDGAYFAGNAVPWYVMFELYDDGVLVHMSDTMYPDLIPVFLPSGYAGLVDEVRVISEFANFFNMDDFTYTIPGGTPCPWDLNGDTFVDVLDLLELLASWGESGVPADINGDGTVDVLDLLELLANWGDCPTG